MKGGSKMTKIEQVDIIFEVDGMKVTAKASLPKGMTVQQLHDQFSSENFKHGSMTLRSITGDTYQMEIETVDVKMH